ncbi:unnamed protein product [Diabrotica balteata]|uniref:Transient receptor potential-gamma protein n=1 Tax=Diabrotica balteata TaxID=107213 RepID=A0A9N9X6B4_DIABA|nr:unnamed protein product [Diabrotica balteata]
MRNLVRRYVTVEQRKAENQGVTEDDVNEIKQDISAFRFELIEILKNSGMNTSTAHNVMGTGGKKNRQKERRLMKGFNIAPQPSTTGSLPPVAEFIASLQQHHQGDAHHHDFFGSTLSGIFTPTQRKLHLHGSTVSSSQGSINEGNGNHHKRLNLKRSQLHKRRWGTLIEAAKSGKVSRLIGRSRSEDSVCNSCPDNGTTHSHSHSNSPASDDNRSASFSDSNPSLDVPDRPDKELHGIAQGLALLKKKRKKFSASRNSSPIVPPTTSTEHSHHHRKMPPKKVLKRASSVPTRVPDGVQSARHEETQSQQDSMEIPTTVPSTLTPSTTEESVTTVGPSIPPSGTSREPLIFNSSSSNPTGSSQTPDEEYNRPSGTHNHISPKLAGIIPLSGHIGPSAGWL